MTNLPSEKIIIYADPEISELIPTFLENRRQDTQDIAQALARNDYEKIRTLGHSMKGSGGGYGFCEISEIGAGLENAAKSTAVREIGMWLKRLSDYLERVEVVYE